MEFLGGRRSDDSYEKSVACEFIKYYTLSIIDLWLWNFPELGLTGAAVATTIGRTAGVIYQSYHLFKGSGMLKIKRHHFKLDWSIQKSIVSLAWPATLQFFIQSGSWIFLAFLVSSTGSTDASAGYQIAIRNVVFLSYRHGACPMLRLL